MIIPSEELFKRQFFCNTFDGECVNTGFATWGRWVLLAVIIIAFLLLAFALRSYSSRRVKSGKAPVTGTGWMVPPSYYQSEQQYNTQGPPAAPPYNPAPGQGDAGYYDNQGNFVQNTNPLAPPPGPPPQTAGEMTSSGGPISPEGYEMNNYYPYDRKGAGNEIEQPTPVHFSESGSSSNNYYPPPPGPPPPAHIP